MTDLAHAPLTRRVWKGRRVLILGLGQYPQGSGISAALLFARLGAQVTVTDLKPARDLKENIGRLRPYKNVRFVLGRHELKDIEAAEFIVPHQRVRQDDAALVLARRLAKPMASEIALFLNHCPATVIGVTGTRGKSTTTSLIAHILKQTRKTIWLGGNILISPLTFLSKVRKGDIIVLELSSFQTESLANARPVDIAVITNLMVDHLNAYATFEEYAESKAQIFRHQTPKQTVILNADDAYGRAWAKEAPSQVVLFGKTQKITAPEHLYGAHNLQNARAAVLAAKAAGATVAQIKKGLATFRPLPHRQEFIRTWRGISFINDTTATTPDGTIAAINTIVPRHQTTWLILGGADKGLGYSELARIIKRHRTRLSILLLPGDASKKIVAAIRGISVPLQSVYDLKEAVDRASQAASATDAVLLSPGAASFNQFANEFERGNEFKRLVQRLR